MVAEHIDEKLVRHYSAKPPPTFGVFRYLANLAARQISLSKVQ